MNEAKYLLRMKIKEKEMLKIKAKNKNLSINKLIKKKLFEDLNW